MPTVYEALFGSPSKMAGFVKENCCSDCYACPFSNAPCYGCFGEVDSDAVERWLEEECGHDDGARESR